MKHLSPAQVAADGPVRTPTRRALAKQQTRAKVLAAARRLFSQEGYEGATIRDIASAAGMSTGAVFANFTDKSDLFREIMTADLEALLGSMREAADGAADVEEALLKVFMAGYGFYKSRLPLARAAFAVWWDQEGGPVLRNLPPLVGIQTLIADLLAGALERGELAAPGELKLRGHMLFETYLANFSQAIFENWTLEALESRARDQIRILLAGARRA